jgi:hypothetical protein
MGGAGESFNIASRKERNVAMEVEQYTQIGHTALRDPVTGDYLPSIPLYVRIADLTGAGSSTAMEGALYDIGAIFAGKMKQYAETLRQKQL